MRFLDVESAPGFSSLDLLKTYVPELYLMNPDPSGILRVGQQIRLLVVFDSYLYEPGPPAVEDLTLVADHRKAILSYEFTRITDEHRRIWSLEQWQECALVGVAHIQFRMHGTFSLVASTSTLVTTPFAAQVLPALSCPDACYFSDFHVPDFSPYNHQSNIEAYEVFFTLRDADGALIQVDEVNGRYLGLCLKTSFNIKIHKIVQGEEGFLVSLTLNNYDVDRYLKKVADGDLYMGTFIELSYEGQVIHTFSKSQEVQCLEEFRREHQLINATLVKLKGSHMALQEDLTPEVSTVARNQVEGLIKEVETQLLELRQEIQHYLSMRQ